MGLGGTAKKLQKVANMAEELYAKLNDLRAQLVELRETVERTSSEVERLEHEQAKNRALLEELAKEQGIDVNDVVADVSPPAPSSGADETHQSRVGESTDTERTSESAGAERSNRPPEK